MIFCQSKGTVAKTLRKLEDKGYIERIINKDNQDTAIYNITASKNAIIKVIEATKGEKQKEVIPG